MLGTWSHQEIEKLHLPSNVEIMLPVRLKFVHHLGSIKKLKKKHRPASIEGISFF
jgi:hypothetical protein